MDLKKYIKSHKTFLSETAFRIIHKYKENPFSTAVGVNNRKRKWYSSICKVGI